MEEQQPMTVALFRQSAVIYAMQGMLAGGIHTSSLSYRDVADEAVKYADALLAAMTIANPK